MQLLFERSEEFSNQSGLSLIEGEVKGFSNYKIKRIPHVGWNKISVNYEKKQLKKNHEKYYYFVHSFFSKPKYKENVIATTSYENFEFCSIVKKNNITGCQFHPEKSGEDGLNFLKSFFKGELK